MNNKHPDIKRTRRSTSFDSLDILIKRWKDGTFGEILDDWRWIFTYSKRYKLAILFYTLLGIVSTSFGLAASVAGKITIVTGAAEVSTTGGLAAKTEKMIQASTMIAPSRQTAA